MCTRIDFFRWISQLNGKEKDKLIEKDKKWSAQYLFDGNEQEPDSSLISQTRKLHKSPFASRPRRSDDHVVNYAKKKMSLGTCSFLTASGNDKDKGRGSRGASLRHCEGTRDVCANCHRAPTAAINEGARARACEPVTIVSRRIQIARDATTAARRHAFQGALIAASMSRPRRRSSSSIVVCPRN